MTTTTTTTTTTDAPLLTSDQIARVDAAIADAERSTSGEILVVVARRSSIYWHAPYEAGLWGAGIALLLATLYSFIAANEWLVLHVGWFLAISSVGFLAGFLLSRIDTVERFFADESIMKAECEERAYRLFAEHGVFRTQGLTGVLVYVSLFEHMVIVLGDSAISAKLGPVEYQAVVSAIISRTKAGNLDQGLVEGVKMLGEHLAKHFPPSEKDVNELPDKMLVIS